MTDLGLWYVGAYLSNDLFRAYCMTDMRQGQAPQRKPALGYL